MSGKWICPDGRRVDHDYVYLALLPVAGRALGRFVGRVESPRTLALEVLKACFRYWIDRDLPRCGEPELVDAAADVAVLIAGVMFEASDVESVMPQFRRWAIQNSRPSFVRRLFRVA